MFSFTIHRELAPVKFGPSELAPAGEQVAYRHERVWRARGAQGEILATARTKKDLLEIMSWE